MACGDTTRVWSPLRAQLGRDDVTALALPGFGNRAPAGFPAAKEAYIEWLQRELAAIRGPIDLVGHDWGALLVVRAVSLEPGRVRTWAAGGAPLDPEYVWHAAAQRWQTPEVGEQVMARITPDPARTWWAVPQAGRPA
jgi:pimeloyl-ACP methyl ester carboxylesterase